MLARTVYVGNLPVDTTRKALRSRVIRTLKPTAEKPIAEEPEEADEPDDEPTPAWAAPASEPAARME